MLYYLLVSDDPAALQGGAILTAIDIAFAPGIVGGWILAGFIVLKLATQTEPKTVARSRRHAKRDGSASLTSGGVLAWRLYSHSLDSRRNRHPGEANPCAG